MLQQLITPIQKAFKRIEKKLISSNEDGQDQGHGHYHYHGEGHCHDPLIKKSLDDEFNRMQQKFRKLEQLMQTKRRLSQSFNLRLAQIEQKLSASMERSQQQKELSLMRRVRQLKKKKLNNSQPEPQARDSKDRPTTNLLKCINSPNSSHINLNPRQSNIAEKLQKITRRKGQIDQNYGSQNDKFLVDLDKKAKVANERRSLHLVRIQERSKSHNLEILEHCQKSMDIKRTEEEEKFNRLLVKMKEKSTRMDEWRKRQEHSSRARSRKLDKRRNTTVINRQRLDQTKIQKNEQFLNKTEMISRTSPLKKTERSPIIEQKMQEFQLEQESMIQEILVKHHHLAERNWIKTVLQEELQNTQHYFNFKVKQKLSF